MATPQETTTFGATVISPSPAAADQHYTTVPLDSSRPHTRCSTPPSAYSPPEKTAALSSNNPYLHHAQNSPASPVACPEKSFSHTHLSPGDLEAGLAPVSQTTTASHRCLKDDRTKDCSAWPTRESLMDQAKLAKRRRQRCSWWFALSKRQRLVCKILIALIVLSLAAGIGVGVSRAVGGGVWSGDGESKNIPQ